MVSQTREDIGHEGAERAIIRAKGKKNKDEAVVDSSSDSDSDVVYLRENLASKLTVTNQDSSLDNKSVVSSTGVGALIKHTSHTASSETTTKTDDSESKLSQSSGQGRVLRPRPRGHPVRDKSGGRLLRSIAVETHQCIISFLPTDRDVGNYARVCKTTSQAVTASVWFNRFNRTYDLPEAKAITVEYLAKLYQFRSELSRMTTCFDIRNITKKKGGFWNFAEPGQLKLLQATNGPHCLEFLQTLIKESNAVLREDSDGTKTIVGLNYEYIRNRILHPNRQHRLDILGAVMNTHDVYFWNPERVVSASGPDSLVLIIQLCLTHLLLDPATFNSFFQALGALEVAHVAAYSSSEQQPVFVGRYKDDINVRFLLSTIRLFHDHLLGDGLLTEQYAALEAKELPQQWLGKLTDGTKTLGTHWKGTHSWMDEQELINFRTGGSDQFFGDYVDEPGVIDLAIFFNEDRFPSNSWPKSLEKLLGTNPYPPTEARISRKLRSTVPSALHGPYPLKAFFGTMKDGTRPGNIYGRIHDLPAQQSIPGFQRISFAKFCYQIVDGSQQYDPDQIWGYEGCVLPGGRVMVGRWYDLTDPDNDAERDPDEQICGPFIYWNTDEGPEIPISPIKALNFLATLKELGIVK